MRFPRQAKIFRGHLDPAPMAAVMFLLVIFMQLSGLLYTPGVLLQVKNGESGKTSGPSIRVNHQGQVLFGTNVYAADNLAPLRQLLKTSRLAPPFNFQPDDDAPPKLVAQVRDALGQINLPPAIVDLMETDNPKVMVTVNYLGQYFYENQLMDDKELKGRLQAAARKSKDLELVINPSEDADFFAIAHLEQLAVEVGIKLVDQSLGTASPAGHGAKPIQ